jgi:type I restriction enzyme S subunit
MVNLKYVSVNINEIKGNNYRLEASVFNIEARNAKEILQKCKFPIVSICGENGLATAFVVGRFKRNYIDAKVKGALGFLGSSEMLELRPTPHKFMVADKKFEKFKVQEGWLLISCSGTIGKPIYVSRTLKNYIFSQHSLRVISKSNQLAGYLYAYLKTEIGQILVQSNNYGAVIQHIEPEHLARVPIPNPTDDIKQEIHDLVMQSFELRDKYNELIDKAEQLLKEELQLPPLHELKPKYVEKIRQYSPSITSQDVKAYSVPLKFLENRFDASFHLPIVSEIIDVLLDSAEIIKPLKEISKKIQGIFIKKYF